MKSKSNLTYIYASIIQANEQLSRFYAIIHGSSTCWHILTNAWPIMARITFQPYSNCPIKKKKKQIRKTLKLLYQKKNFFKFKIVYMYIFLLLYINYLYHLTILKPRVKQLYSFTKFKIVVCVTYILKYNLIYILIRIYFTPANASILYVHILYNWLK